MHFVYIENLHAGIHKSATSLHAKGSPTPRYYCDIVLQGFMLIKPLKLQG